MDQEFAYEQEHLSNAHAKLTQIFERLNQELEREKAAFEKAVADRLEDVTFNFSSDDDVMETLADLEANNLIIDSYGDARTATKDELKRMRLLLRRPYFAKVSLEFKPGQPPRDIYLGAAGAVDENRRHFIVDWRSPVAEVYYNQANGRTSYEANGRTIEVDLKLRRQFDLSRDKLHAYFDTTVAIEDPLLLASLSERRSDKMQAITATIQKEQNEVVRHKDVPVLLVNGIAGSGKTSVLLQRIAYLLYQERDTLKPDQVYLFSPNPVFERYIDGVLPDMGERNPQILTWKSLIAALGLADHGAGDDVPASVLLDMEEKVKTLTLEPRDFSEIRIGDRVLIKVTQVQNTAGKYARIPLGSRFTSLVKEDLHEKLDSRLAQLAMDEDVQDEMQALDVDTQVEIFGYAIAPSTEAEVVELAQQYVHYCYYEAHDLIENASWLRIDRIGMRLLGTSNLSAVEWLYLKLLITGDTVREARYVMVDEVQDYTEAQLMVLTRYFAKAHFLLLGDEHQAIKESTATFPQIRQIFDRSFGEVDECRLLTSYRSSPEITELFTRLLSEEERGRTSSVRREGHKPHIKSCADESEWLAALQEAVEKGRGEEGLTAVITQTKDHAWRLAKQLGETVTLMDGKAPLPSEGVVVINLLLAKGLEFDRVIIPDADERTYPDTPLSRRRLYTALSRATQHVTVLSQGPLTPLM